MPTICPETTDHQHDWECVGTCWHTSQIARSCTYHEAYRCRACGRVAHSMPHGHLSGLPPSSEQVWRAIEEEEYRLCPIAKTMAAQREGARAVATAQALLDQQH